MNRQRIIEQLRAKARSTTFPAERAALEEKADALEAKYGARRTAPADGFVGATVRGPRGDQGTHFARGASRWATNMDARINDLSREGERIRQARETPRPPPAGSPWQEAAARMTSEMWDPFDFMGGHWRSGTTWTTETPAQATARMNAERMRDERLWAAEDDRRTAATRERIRQFEEKAADDRRRRQLQDLIDGTTVRGTARSTPPPPPPRREREAHDLRGNPTRVSSTPFTDAVRNMNAGRPMRYAGANIWVEGVVNDGQSGSVTGHTDEGLRVTFTFDL